MANNNNKNNSLSLSSVLEKDKLTGPNFFNWERNLQIVLRHEQKWYVLENPIGPAPTANAPVAVKNAYHRTVAKLHNMLKTAEKGIKQNSKDVLVVASGNHNKNGGK
ncbi:hypothetical protein Tco_1322410, partial [Tanacetum coccineum]